MTAEEMRGLVAAWSGQAAALRLTRSERHIGQAIGLAKAASELDALLPAPRPPEPDRTAALARDADHDWTTALMVIAEFEALVAALVEALTFLSTYEKNPPEVIKDDYAYDRLLAFVHDVATRALATPEPAPVTDGTA